MYYILNSTLKNVFMIIEYINIFSISNYGLNPKNYLPDE
jgi:hypothetical protein